MDVLPRYGEYFRRSLHRPGLLNAAFTNIAKDANDTAVPQNDYLSYLGGLKIFVGVLAGFAGLFYAYFLIASIVKYFWPRKARPALPWPSPRLRKVAFVTLGIFIGFFTVISIDTLISTAFGVNPVPFMRQAYDLFQAGSEYGHLFYESIHVMISIPGKGVLWAYLLISEPFDSEVGVILKVESLRSLLSLLRAAIEGRLPIESSTQNPHPPIDRATPLGQLLYHPQMEHYYANMAPPMKLPNNPVVFLKDYASAVRFGALFLIILILAILLSLLFVCIRSYQGFGAKKETVQGHVRSLTWYALVLLPTLLICLMTTVGSVLGGSAADSLTGYPGAEVRIPSPFPGYDEMSTKEFWDWAHQAKKDGDAIKVATKLYAPVIRRLFYNRFSNMPLVGGAFNTLVNVITSNLEAQGLEAFESSIARFYDAIFFLRIPWRRGIPADFAQRIIPLLQALTSLDHAAVMDSAHNGIQIEHLKKSIIYYIGELQTHQTTLQEILRKISEATSASMVQHPVVKQRMVKTTMDVIKVGFDIGPLASKYISTWEALSAYTWRLSGMAFGFLLLFGGFTLFALFRLVIRNFCDSPEIMAIAVDMKQVQISQVPFPCMSDSKEP